MQLQDDRPIPIARPLRPPPTLRERWMAGLVLLVGIVVLFVLAAGGGMYLPACTFRKATGWLCPGCGSTRMVTALLAGEIQAAFALNPFVFLCLPLAAAAGLQLLALACLGRRLFMPKAPACLWPWLPICVGVYWIGRNLIDNPAMH